MISPLSKLSIFPVPIMNEVCQASPPMHVIAFQRPVFLSQYLLQRTINKFVNDHL